MNRPCATLVLLLAAVHGCAAELEPPRLRLGDHIRPVRYALDLTLDPERDDFSGSVDIDLQLRSPAAVIWLNATDLSIEQATLRSGGSVAQGQARPGGKDFIGIAFPAPVPPGAAKLHITYRGALNRKSSAGLFKVKEGNDWYIFTQFEAIDARRAFPCFDEPSFKVPWELTLHVRKEHAALGNMPIASETGEPGGRKKVRFAVTPPLPSYLVAMAVGPLEFVDAGRAGKKRAPIRIVTPKGKSFQAKYAAEITAAILDRLEAYFGIPYPYSKLDNLAVPLMGGAMENAGLVTYSQTLILADPALDSIGRQRSYASVCAHELAHQWFGDLVTMAWWDDTWLNEAFASWTASKIISEWKPDWRSRLSDVSSRQYAMEQDGLASARKIRQPIESNNDIANAFDGITYQKGAAVIRMFESWMGEEAFQKGVQGYLRQHAWKNAASGDFLDALSSSSQRGLTKAFSSFLEQAGVALVSVELTCASGTASVRLTQKRALPLGSPASSGQTWQIPVCFRYSAGGEVHRECTLLSESAMEWKLQSKSCPDWISANADGAGYYRVLYKGDLLEPLLAGGGKALAETERVMLLGDTSALMGMGTVKASDALALVPAFGRDERRQIVVSAASIAGEIRNHLVPKDLEANYVRFIQQVFGERARRLGWHPQPGEDDDTRLLRAFLTPFVARNGEDAELAAEARRLAERWLDDRKAVDPNITGQVLQIAASRGDRALFDRFLAAAKATEDRRQRGYLLSALGSFRDPSLARAGLDLLLSGAFDMREALTLLYGPMRYAATRALPFEFVKANFDELVKRSPIDTGASFPYVGSAFCDERSRSEVEAFFTKRVENFNGGPRNLAQTLESIRLCEALVDAQQSSVTEFLRRY